jgi:hypothetical protein
VAAFLLIMIDSTLLVTPDRLSYRFCHRLNVKLKIAESPFLLRGKEPIITLFVYPLSPFFISSLKEPSRNRAEIKRTLLQQKIAVCESGVLRALGLTTLILGVLLVLFSVCNME